MDLEPLLNILDHKNAPLITSALVLFALISLWRKYRQMYSLREEFINIVSHKFRTPLSTTKWTLENIIPMTLDPLQRKGLEDIQHMNNHLIHLTNTLIELAEKDRSSIRTYNVERVSISEIVADVSRRMKEQFNSKNIIFGTHAGNNIFVKADKARLTFIIETLLQNSLAYTRVSGMVNIVVSTTWNKVTVKVEDNGIGIDKSDMRAIFKKFHQGKNAQSVYTEGLGVGLYLARKIARKLNGKITAKSPGLNRGATFILTLPKVK